MSLTKRYECTILRRPLVVTFLHWAAVVLEVLATQMNSVLATWIVSRLEDVRRR